MISYAPLWDTLIAKNLSTYDLIYKMGFSANTVYRMKHGKNVTTKTLDDMCFALDCRIEDIVRHENE